MTDQEINIAIAEACGWKLIVFLDGELHGWIEPGPLEPIPDYCRDLNAIQAAVLGQTQEWQDRFTIQLTRLCGSHKLAINAPANKRAEAFLKTVGKWKD